MAHSILIVDPEADWFASQLNAAFPGLEVRAARSAAQVGDAAADVEALGCMPAWISEDLVARAPRLRWVQAFTTGTDRFESVLAGRRGVAITSTRGMHGPQMAEMACLLMLSLARDYPRMLRNQDRRVWDRFAQKRLYGKTAVILGVGVIGAELALRCKAFGMTVIGVTRTPRVLPGFDRMMRYEEIEPAVALADFLNVLVPYEKQTHRLVNARVLAAMKPSAYLVNIARGGVCDEDALIEALRAGRIAGAGIDVFTQQPLPPESPFWGLDNVIVTPHMGGQCDVYNALVCNVLKKNVQCFLEDRIAQMVNLVRS
ncbi:MAG: D-2-hydroxyacid dehydrogenase [Burkholderiales bacterium]|nr:D-2-hydroxyacid dehydrogenase [Burkholderiales bacterium]